MGKKKSSGIKYNNEEEAYNDLMRLIKVWKNNGTTYYHRSSYLKSLKTQFRSARICEIIFSNDRIFDLNKEIPYVPLDIMTEDNLIKLIYDFPGLICPVDRLDRIKDVYIPEEKLTLPVCVAFELGKRRYEKISALQWGGLSGVKYPYPEKALKYRNTLIAIADEIEEVFGNNFFELSFSFKDDKEKSAFTQRIVDLIKEKSNIDSLQPDERYEPKYRHYDYKLDKKLIILVAGYADSGKTTFSHYLSNMISSSMCFDSDQLLEKNLLLLSLSEIVNPKKM